MAVLRPSPPSLLLLLALTSILFRSSPVHSLTCSSQKFTNKKVYSNCTDLPTLNATLHWTYENASLSIAFSAPPATPSGWIAWAINPTATGMAGCQSLIAFKDSNGSMTVKTYNISSYSSIVEGKIAFEVPEASAEFSGGVMVIFATVELTERVTELNHVWQVGGSVTDGMPGKHEFLPGNLNSVGKLQLEGGGESNATAGPPAVSPAVSPAVTAGGPAVAAASPAVAPSASSASYDAGVYGIVTIIGCLLSFF